MALSKALFAVFSNTLDDRLLQELNEYSILVLHSGLHSEARPASPCRTMTDEKLSRDCEVDTG
jgi:hypothetical protein